MKTCIAARPNSVSVDAGSSYFQSYKGGYINNASLCGTTVDHAIVAVGYGTNSTYGDYWIVRNSWGTGWGASGYGNITASTPYPGMCAINKNPQYVNVASS